MRLGELCLEPCCRSQCGWRGGMLRTRCLRTLRRPYWNAEQCTASDRNMPAHPDCSRRCCIQPLSCFAQAMLHSPSHPPTRLHLRYPWLLRQSVSAADRSTGACQQHISCGQQRLLASAALSHVHPLAAPYVAFRCCRSPLLFTFLALLTCRLRRACVSVLRLEVPADSVITSELCATLTAARPSALSRRFCRATSALLQQLTIPACCDRAQRGTPLRSLRGVVVTSTLPVLHECLPRWTVASSRLSNW